MAQKFITYKQRPLVRMGNLIFTEIRMKSVTL